jgi:non-ribosomal peptide synthetase component F
MRARLEPLVRRELAERNLDWLAAVLAVFKAGGVYLPIEPHFPADRIGRMLSRAGCGLVLTEPGSTATVDQALESLPDVQTLLIESAYREDHADGDLGVEVAADQLALSISLLVPPVSRRVRCASTPA